MKEIPGVMDVGFGDSAASAIAIVGVAGRFPGARNPQQFWANLCCGVDSLTLLSDEELRRSGVDPEALRDPNYVKMAAVLDDIDLFDASFFGFSPRDAAIMDPQHRMFLECAWEAVEDAGWRPDHFPGSIGVYAGSGMNSYLIFNLLPNRKLMSSAGLFLLKQTGNDKDVLATRVSYQLNLTGPSMAIQTACSTSLVATHVASQSLLNHDCDMALAGGVTIEIPHKVGYVYREGEILSRDGHCRSFDANSTGTVFGSGAGVVVLRRLDDALADGDHIYAIIRGTAINNDGSRKAGYLAPSVSGQVDVIAEAHSVADVDADSISYVETHGTGTQVGDPIEITALTQAFRRTTQRRQFCAIGSVKTNIGHLDAAAGVAGLLKTALSLEKKQVPPSLHFSKPNPMIDFANSPFYVNDKLAEWKAGPYPRRAGVTSLGIGGTNAHVILEEAPPRAPSGPSRPWQILTVSAKTASALDAASQRLAEHLGSHPDLALADVAYTCHVGRKAFSHRRAIVCQTHQDAIDALRNSSSNSAVTANDVAAKGVVFLFPGQGSQYANMARGIYETEPVFRSHLDHCAELLSPQLGLDLRGSLFPAESDVDEANERLAQTWLTQPALFAVEFALAQLWMSWGIRPAAMIGHSLGEFVAACLSGVLSLEDALTVVAARGRLIQSLPGGAMIAVAMSEPETHAFASEKVSLAAVNAPRQCVLSGTADAIDHLERTLSQKGILSHRLKTSHAFHSASVEAILDTFAGVMRGCQLQKPQIPYIANVTGTWIRPDEATDPAYWARHVRQPVRFLDGLREVLHYPAHFALEVGPGRSLATFAAPLVTGQGKRRVFASLPSASEAVDDIQSVLTALAYIWTCSDEVNWSEFHSRETRHRVSLPTYPFERQRHWIEAPASARVSIGQGVAAESSEAPSEPSSGSVGYYSPVWKRSDLHAPADLPRDSSWLIFGDAIGLGGYLAGDLAATRRAVTVVLPGAKFAKTSGNAYTIRPGHRPDYDSLITDLLRSKRFPQRILHLWSITETRSGSAALETLEHTQDLSFYSLLFLAQAMGTHDLSQPVGLTIVSNNLQDAGGTTVHNPERAVLLGPCRVIPKEFSNITCSAVDVVLPGGSDPASTWRNIARQILRELSAPVSDVVIAYRSDERWIQLVEPARIDASSAVSKQFRNQGVYVITGGLGAIGLEIAEYLARNFQARLVLVGRSKLPPKADGDAYLQDSGADVVAAGVIRRIRQMETLGAEVLITTADVTELSAVNRVIEQARTKFRTIHGVIHAAGVLNDGLIQLKNKDVADSVLAPKLRGTLVLDKALRGLDLDFVALFSSLSSWTAPIGQVDYVAASAFLDAFATSRVSGSHRTVAIDWAKWRNVGMGGRVSQAGRAEASSATPVAARNHPLLGVPSMDTPEVLAYNLELRDHWMVQEHRLRDGGSLFPGSGYVELACEAMWNRFGPGVVQLDNLLFLAPLGVDAGGALKVGIRFVKNGDPYAFSAVARRGEGDSSTTFATGLVQHRAALEAPSIDLNALLSRCSRGHMEFDGQNPKQAEHIDFGPRWRSLKRIYFGNEEAVSLLELPKAFAAELEVLRSHPALLDMVTGSAICTIPEYGRTRDLYIPVSYKRLTLYSALDSRCYCHIRPAHTNATSGEIVSFDLTVIGEDGQVIAEASEFVLRRLNSARALSVLPLLDGTREAGSADPDTAGLPEKAVIEIESSAAVEALPAILGAHSLTRVVVAPIGLQLTAQRRSEASPPAHGRQPGLPHVRSSGGAIPPRSEIERMLTELWQELLGVEQVGARDDFFELGGHSLLAVQLLARVEREFQKTIPLHVFSQNGTIEATAALIGISKQAKPSALVMLNNQGTGPSIFCVGPIGGDVYGFRHLVQALGTGQNFVGIQSPPEKRVPEFATSLEEVAAYYVNEMIAFQPEGPYILCGSSVGATIALEMAQQIQAAGRKVDLLIAIDGGPFNTGAETPRSSVLFWWKFLRNVPAWIRDETLTKKQLLNLISIKFIWLGKMISGAFRKRAGKVYSGVERFLNTSVYSETQVQFMNTMFGAFRSYVPKPYSGRVVLYFARVRPVLHLLEVDLAWLSIARDLEIVHVPGNHVSLIREPNVSVIAADLRRRVALLGNAKEPIAPTSAAAGD